MNEDIRANERVQKREHYSDWINRSVGFGVGSFFIATGAWMVFEEPLILFAGLALYWLGCAGMGIFWWLSPVSIHDELEEQMQLEASEMTLSFVSLVTIVGIPGSVVLDSTGVYTLPAAIQGALWGYLFLVLVFAFAYHLAERRYE